MRPDDSPNACWTSFVGAPMHDLGALPEKCFTCAAKTKEGRRAKCQCGCHALHPDFLCRVGLSHVALKDGCCPCNPPRDTAPKVGQD